ncbi:MAG: N-acetylmuramoyl-L-alanine amidase [Armatimonadetes bacterium]|nr:N-acetylmuramoyl-L-alanine amidase [Armatimonadota bacterium]
MKRQPCRPILLLLALIGLSWWLAGAAGAQERQEPGESGPVTVGEAAQLKLILGGKAVPVKVRRTSLPEEFLIRADAPALGAVARAFGRSVEWSEKQGTLFCVSGERKTGLKIDQARYPDEAGGRQLEAPPRMLDGAAHVPLSILEDMLDVRLTVHDKSVYVEPVIRSVRLDGDPRKPALVIQATGPVTYKTFRLKGPDRYVIDVRGAVLDAPRQKIHHPQMGSIRMGQFELGPAVSRIVVPTEIGVAVKGPATGAGKQFAFQLELPAVKAPAQNFQVQKLTRVDLEKMARGQRLVLEASGPFQYEWHRLNAPDNRFFLDIPQAVLSGPKQDIDPKDPYVGAIRISQYQPEPSPVVRVVVDLKRPADLRLMDGDNENSVALEIHHREVDPAFAALRGFGTSAFPAPGGVICIDAGHGGSDPGAVNRSLGVTEAEVTLDIANRLAAILKKQGWNVVMTRNADRDVSWAGSSARQELGARAKVANDLKADLFLSIHCNASASSQSNGTSLHYFKRADHLLAQDLQGSLLSGTGRANRGLQKNRFYVLAHTEMPAVLVETAFLTNPAEGSLLRDPDYRQRVAESLAQGLRLYASNHMNWAAAGR